MSCFFFKSVAIRSKSFHDGAFDPSTSTTVAFVILFFLLDVDDIVVKKSIAFVKNELLDEAPVRTTVPLFVLFERVAIAVDDDAPVVVLVEDEGDAAVPLIVSKQKYEGCFYLCVCVKISFQTPFFSTFQQSDFSSLLKRAPRCYTY